MTPTTEVTELLLPLRRVRIVRPRPGGGATLELAGIGGALLLLVATMYVGNTAPLRRATAEVLPQAPPALVAQGVTATAVAAVAPAAAAPAVTPGRTPNVVGMTRDAAATALLAAGYRSVGWVAEQSQTRAAGSVVRQEPAAGSPVQSGTARLIVAR